MEWGVEHGDPLKFYSLTNEAKVVFLAAMSAKHSEQKSKSKKKLPAGLSLFDKPSWE